MPGMSKALAKMQAKDEREQRGARVAAGGARASSDEDSDASEDDDVARIDRMADEIEQANAQRKEYAMNVDRKEAKRDRKTKALVELQRQKQMDVSDDEMMDNKELMRGEFTGVHRTNHTLRREDEASENDDDLDEERTIRSIAKDQVRLKRQKTKEDEDEEEK